MNKEPTLDLIKSDQKNKLLCMYVVIIKYSIWTTEEEEDFGWGDPGFRREGSKPLRGFLSD